MPPDPQHDDPGEQEEFNVDELARRCGTTVRNVRLYQERGLLPRPRRQGRSAFYGPHHQHRLQLVLRLMDRGYSMASIRELVHAWDTQRDLGDVLGLEEALARPFIEEPPGWISAEDLANLYPSADPETDLLRAIELGVIVPDGDGFAIPMPGVFDGGAGLVATGVPVSAVLDTAELMLRSTAELADAFIGMFLEHVWAPYEAAGEPAGEAPRVAEIINRQRPLAVRSVVSALEQAMQRRHDAALMMDTDGADTA
jgi:DNA-binding transcriptional MerR regulator